MFFTLVCYSQCNCHSGHCRSLFSSNSISKTHFLSHPGSRLALTDIITGRNLSFLTPHDRNTSNFLSDSRSWRWWPLSFIIFMLMIWSWQILQKTQYASKLSIISESVVLLKWIYFCLSTGTMFYKTSECFLYCFSRHSNYVAQKAYIYWCIPRHNCCAQGAQ